MNETDTAKTQEGSRKLQRSAAYPSITLEQAIESSKTLLEAYRRNAFSREDGIKALGYTKITGDNAQRIAALGHYGLVERAGSAYKNTELAESILHFTNDDDRMASIVQAAQSPKLFSALIEAFKGQTLPSRLAAILVRSHAINPNVSEKVAENFKKTLEFSGLAVNGIVSDVQLMGAVGEEETVEDTGGFQTTAKPAGMHPKPPRMQHPSADMQAVSLPSGLVISYPADMAYLFVTGVFADEIAALEKKASVNKPKAGIPNNDDSTPAE